MTITIDRLEDLESDLTSRAFLYDDPKTFRAAIDLAMTMLREVARTDERPMPLTDASEDEVETGVFAHAR